MKQTKGFTLLEILLVIAAIGILAAIVIVAINPQRQLAQVRDAERQSSIGVLARALNQYLIDNGSYPSSVTSVYAEVCNTKSESIESASVDCSDYLDLRELVPTYIAAVPFDSTVDSPGTGYEVAVHGINQSISLRSFTAEIVGEIEINPIDYYQEQGQETVATATQEGNIMVSHTFQDPGDHTFEVPQDVNEVEVLVVAGGGSGGTSMVFNNAGAGGGGAGGLVYREAHPISLAEIALSVGAGGTAPPPSGNTRGENGQDTTFDTLVALGGGGGSGGNTTGRSGGSGGGSRGSSNVGTATQPTSSSGGSGNDGGLCDNSPGGAPASGGGGAGSAGVDIACNNGDPGGFGGEGLQFDIAGESRWYAAGGGGGGAQSNTFGLGGNGVGGNGGNNQTEPTPGAAGTGSGGGGGNNDRPGANGGSGVVVVRYLIEL